ncbi:MAG: outer membrane protein transport protein, partial [Deltaproteobacteria bacterium]|nr:outer membrane protein transport protein [Deltaproteobacteria bacterium]
TDRLDVNLSFVGAYGSVQAPADGPNTDVRATSFVPLPMMTAAYRLTERLAAGVFFYTPSGAGATFDDVSFGVPGLPPRPFGTSMYDFEGGPALAFRLPWRLNLGIAYRMTWVRGRLRGYDPASLASGIPLYAETSMSGTDFTGFKIGVQANPTSRLKLGLAYRTPIAVDLSGKTSVTDVATSAVAEMDITARVKNVDKLLAGVTYEWIEGMFLTSLDYERQFYSRSSDIVVVSAAGSMNTPQRFSDSNILRLGGEVRVKPNVPLRLGVGFFDDFRDHAYLNATSGGAPAPTYLVSMGAGWGITRTLSLELSYTLMSNSGTLGAAGLAPTGTAGEYSSTTQAFSLNVGFQS